MAALLECFQEWTAGKKGPFADLYGAMRKSPAFRPEVERVVLQYQCFHATCTRINSLKVRIDAIKQEVASLDERSHELFQTAFQLINSAIRESREISHNLMPKVIEDFGLVPALESLLNKIRQVTEIEFVFYHNMSAERLDYDIQ